MAASIKGVFNEDLQQKIKDSSIFVVGAGGIGCEILKNLVLSGFEKIEIIDLDTIDVSNLNRQFLFHREHIGKPKAVISKESALQFNPHVNITAYYDSIFNTKFGVNFYKKFNIVLNALDNRAARNHVNRMCLNAEVPLIESGTAGYNGQVELISKGLTQCYECTPKPVQKSFPGCTIRNTPSEPIHCIVWAKHLFNQLFGESIEDEDISPDKADPEAQNEVTNGNDELHDGKEVAREDGNIIRINTRQWAKEILYNPKALFEKFFYDDINYLLSMSNLWKTRKAPSPIKFVSECLKDSFNNAVEKYHQIWTLNECMMVFANSLQKISEKFLKLEKDESLVWDKDDQAFMDFVAASANIRASIFGIPLKSRFEIKSMAGNIIPAIATTNAITAGVVVMHALKILSGQQEKCKNVYMRLRQNPRQQLVVPEKIFTPPNPNCYVCAADPAITLKIDTGSVTIKDFRDHVLIKSLNMLNPDVMIDTKGIVVISSEEGETECNEQKFLKEMDIVDGVILQCDDFFQNYQINVIIEHFDSERDGPTFEVVPGKNKLMPKAECEGVKSSEKTDNNEKENCEQPHTSKKNNVDNDSDDDLCIVDDDEEVPTTSKSVFADKTAKKRKPSEDVTEILDSDEEGPTQSKKSRKMEDADVEMDTSSDEM